MYSLKCSKHFMEASSIYSLQKSHYFINWSNLCDLEWFVKHIWISKPGWVLYYRNNCGILHLKIRFKFLCKSILIYLLYRILRYIHFQKVIHKVLWLIFIMKQFLNLMSKFLWLDFTNGILKEQYINKNFCLNFKF